MPEVTNGVPVTAVMLTPAYVAEMLDGVPEKPAIDTNTTSMLQPVASNDSVCDVKLPLLAPLFAVRTKETLTRHLHWRQENVTLIVKAIESFVDRLMTEKSA